MRKTIFAVIITAAVVYKVCLFNILDAAVNITIETITASTDRVIDARRDGVYFLFIFKSLLDIITSSNTMLFCIVILYTKYDAKYVAEKVGFILCLKG